MPNTLAHLGIQGVLTRKLIDNSDLKWIYAGCIIPDLSWILQRVFRTAIPDLDPYYLRSYVIVQTSLFFCLIISTGFAALSDNFWKTFKILGLNSFLHLFLDACQTKWANGVHFLAPFDWRLTNFSFFWPESLPTYLLTFLGLIYLTLNWNRCITNPTTVTIKPVSRIIAVISIISIYFVLPFFLLSGPEKANNHFVKTLHAHEERSGKYTEFDRCGFQPCSDGDILTTFAGEEISIDGIKSSRPATVSVRGTFVSGNKILVKEYHVHSKWFRDYSSYLGLILVTVLWIWTPASQIFRKRNKDF